MRSWPISSRSPGATVHLGSRAAGRRGSNRVVGRSASTGDSDRAPAVPVREQTGETFEDVRELKRILANEHRADFERCLTEKLLTYALGRGLEFYDVETVDQITRQLEKAEGRFSALLLGIVDSAPFQKQRPKANATFSDANDNDKNTAEQQDKTNHNHYR